MSVIHAALAGNPNVGKSTVFNALTGLRQHTGNWPGKTVETKTGTFTHAGHTIHLTDVPGTYSLDAASPEEAVTREFLSTSHPDCVVIVCDCVTLSRNLILTLQILAQFPRCVLCLNLMDEAEKRGITVDTETLAVLLGCPVIPCAARQKCGLEHLQNAIIQTALAAFDQTSPATITNIPARAASIARQVIREDPNRTCRREIFWDRIFTGRFTAYPTMALLVLLVFWLTLQGAGYLSAGLEKLFALLLPACRDLFSTLHIPPLWISFLTDGILSTLTQVIAVMLPPMAVFFPLFTLLEDLGYLPRAAFNLDRLFCGCGACGKQALTMLMGLGCNAVGVTGCRIIDSPRERKLAILTNTCIPCNGRLPVVLFLTAALVSLSTGRETSNGIQTVLLALVLLVCTVVTLLLCRLLSVSILRGTPSAFALELPSYRIPQVGQVLIRSVLDRTIVVLGRAVSIAAPTGAILWLLHHICWQDISLFSHCIRLLEPIGRFFGMDGVILLAFLLSLPASELFLPMVLAGYGLAGDASFILQSQSWTGVTVLCVLWFTLFHWPCAATILTIRRETGSHRWTAAAVLLPTSVGLLGCLLIHLVSLLFYM